MLALINVPRSEINEICRKGCQLMLNVNALLTVIVIYSVNNKSVNMYDSQMNINCVRDLFSFTETGNISSIVFACTNPISLLYCIYRCHYMAVICML